MAVTSSYPKSGRARPVYYPASDGKPMGETQWHVRLIAYSTEALDMRFRDDPNVYVAGNNFVYYEEGNSKARLSPDTYVVFGASKRDRDSYFSWQEGGRLPDVVFEFTSRSTRAEDNQKKFRIYEQVWRASEYIQFDPKGDYLRPPLRGFHLVNGVYAPMPLQGDRLHSKKLGLDIVWEGSRIRFYDPVQKRWYGTYQEQREMTDEAVRRADEEARRAETAEAEIARLRAELDALKRPGS